MKTELKVIATLELSPQARGRIRDISEGIQLTVIPADSPEKVPDEAWAGVEVLYTGRVLPNPEKVPNLKWVQFNSAGVEKFIDHPLVQDKEVVATTMSGVITGQIAEYVLMAMLALGQKLPQLRGYQRERKWPGREEKRSRLLPVELQHSTVGILGYGSIGRQVARLLRPFGATILAAKKDVTHPEDSGYTPTGTGDPHGDFFHRLYPIEALHSLLAECDFVLLALPLTEATTHLMDADAIKAMKASAYLINVGRGGLVDQSALVRALKEEKIAGAALDVFEEEPLPEDSPLWEMANVIVTPHISGLSQQLEEETLSLFIENLQRFMGEQPLINRIDHQRGY